MHKNHRIAEKFAPDFRKQFSPRRSLGKFRAVQMQMRVGVSYFFTG